MQASSSRFVADCYVTPSWAARTHFVEPKKSTCIQELASKWTAFVNFFWPSLNMKITLIRFNACNELWIIQGAKRLELMPFADKFMEETDGDQDASDWSPAVLRVLSVSQQPVAPLYWLRPCPHLPLALKATLWADSTNFLQRSPSLWTPIWWNNNHCLIIHEWKRLLLTLIVTQRWQIVLT